MDKIVLILLLFTFTFGYYRLYIGQNNFGDPIFGVEAKTNTELKAGLSIETWFSPRVNDLYRVVYTGSLSYGLYDYVHECTHGIDRGINSFEIKDYLKYRIEL